MISIDVLRRVEKKLRREYPEIVGVGIGLRRKGNRIRRELALKLTVRKKRSSRARGLKLLPRHIELVLGKGRRPMIVRLETDIEEARIWRPLQFSVADGAEVATATCLARWRSGGTMHFGVVTAGHGVWLAGRQLTVDTRRGQQPGVVRVSSDLSRDHLDATLVEFSAAVITEADLLPATPLASVRAPLTVVETLALIGDSTTDGKDIRIKQWARQLSAADALAFHSSYSVDRGTSVVILNNVVEAKGDAGMFVPGVSGATWATATSAADGCPMAFTSHGCDTAAVGTHIVDAAQWLQRTGALEDFALAWVSGQWWRV